MVARGNFQAQAVAEALELHGGDAEAAYQHLIRGRTPRDPTSELGAISDNDENKLSESELKFTNTERNEINALRAKNESEPVAPQVKQSVFLN